MITKKRQVLKHAQQLFVEKGIMATSVQDILAKSNISKGTFYNYFPSKNDCLKSILKLGDEETHIRRQELLIGQDPSDRLVLIKQIAIRLQVNVDHNLLPIIEAIFHSEDSDLSAFAKNIHLKELHWLTGRLVDVYGEETRPYAADCSVLLMGMLQHSLFLRRTNAGRQMTITRLIAYLMRRMDDLIPSVIAGEDALFGDGLFQQVSGNEGMITDIKQKVLDNLSAFQKQLNREKGNTNDEYIEFLLEEINQEHPRYRLIKTITQSFRSTFKDTPYEQTVFKLASEIWSYIQAENNTK